MKTLISTYALLCSLISIAKVWKQSESEVAQSCPTLETPWTVAHQAPLSMGYPRQEYWSGLPFILQGTELGSPELQADSLLSEPQGKNLSAHQ